MAIWILGVFQTSSSFSIKTIAGFIPIYLYLCKLSGRAQLRAHSLLYNHILHLLLKLRLSLCNDSYCFLLDSLFSYQQKMIKGPIIDMDNRFNEIFPAFDLYNKEFSPSSWIIDIFPSWFSFHPFNKYSENNLISWSCQLDDLMIVSSLDPSYTLVVTDTSVKNNITTSIAHIHVHNKPVIKILHHTVNIITTEAELFAIRCGINQAISISGISKIIVITDSLHATWRIFDSSLSLFQIHSVSISNELRRFFLQNLNTSIKFWKCSSHCNWSLYKAVDKKSKQFHSIPYYPCKSSWDFSKKSKCNDILSIWKITFQASDLKGHQFLELCDEDNNSLKPLYSKDGTWLKYFGHSNSLCTRATRVIVNHAPISKYRLRFFHWEDFSC